MTLTDALNEIALYKQKPLDSIMSFYKVKTSGIEGHVKWSSIVNAEVAKLKLNKSNQNDLDEYYFNTENYIFELMEYHSTRGKQDLVKRYIELLKSYGSHTVLDYGCGVAQDSIDIANEGLSCSACDLPGKTFDFAKWRVKQSKLDIEMIAINDGDFLKNKIYNAITCFEVLQQTIDPMHHVKYIRDHLTVNGYFIFTARFDNDYELTLDSNKKYSSAFDQMVIDVGFQLVLKELIYGDFLNGKYLHVFRRLSSRD